jgi:helicase required for RNAi-mediated heterochromatin assembly 1
MASSRDVTVATQIIQDHVLRPYENECHPEAWRDMPEIPDKLEIMPKEEVREKKDFFDENWNAYQSEVEYNSNLPRNIVKGPWPSKEEYIASHYQILREDALASLRASVKSVKRTPDTLDDRFTHIYTDVGLTTLCPLLPRAKFRPDPLQGFTAWTVRTSLPD